MSPRHERARAQERRNAHSLEVVLLLLLMVAAALHLFPSCPGGTGQDAGTDPSMSVAEGRWTPTGEGDAS